jgi:hypothetical protein
MPTPVRWLLGALALLALAVAIFLALFQWNWLRGPIDSYLSAKFNRQVTIHGNLTGDVWNWTPSLTGENVTVAQPAWAPPGAMATFPRLKVAVDLRALLGGRFELTEVDAAQPTIHLMRDAKNRNNWTFGPAAEAAPQPLRLPPIRHLAVDGGHVDYADAVSHLTFAGVLTSNERLADYGHGRFELTGDGAVAGAPFSAHILGGVLIGVDPNQPYPFQADIHAGATHAALTGSIRRPFDLGVFDAHGTVSGNDLSDLDRLTGLALPSSPPYQLTGDLTRAGSRFDVTHLTGRLGSSDLAGHVTVSEADGRRLLTGDLVSQRLKLADLTAVVGGAPRAAMRGTVTSPAQQAAAARLTAEHRLLPDARLDVTRFRQMDADVRYRAETVDAGPLPVRQVVIHARLDHGLLTLDPLSLILPQGALSGQVRLDARHDTPVTTLNLALANARAEELLPHALGVAPATGALTAAARLTGAGGSVREAAGNAGGTLTVAMPAGQMRKLLAEVMGVDVARSLFLYLTHDTSSTPIRCAVADFRADHGVLTVQRLVIDTGAVLATGKGDIDLRNETMNIEIDGKPKHLRLLHLAAPITLKGSLSDPHTGVDIAKAVPQAGLSAVLGVLVAPVAAILPLVGVGTAHDADCSALLGEAERLGAPVGH